MYMQYSYSPSLRKSFVITCNFYSEQERGLGGELLAKNKSASATQDQYSPHKE